METIGRYRITHKLGEGGMGVVHAAHDTQLDRAVAIKRIRLGMSDERSRQRLRREARVAASISHPNVCQLFEIGEHEGQLFVAMELLQGEPLSAAIARGPLSAGDAVQVSCEMLAALSALHDRGLVHRDLKPSNLFLTPFGVKLLDFGLTRALASADTPPDITMTGTILGTPQYMAPEAFAGDAIDHRADLFAAGVILHEMLTGKAPFAGKSTAQVLRAVLSDEPPPITGSAQLLALDGVARQALDKRPEGRYQSAPAMLTALREASPGAPARRTLELAVAVRTTPIGPAAPITRLMALPFRLLRPDPEVDFLAFSLPDAVTNSLSGLGSLVVRSMLAASRFNVASPDLGQIAREAAVDVVLTGTLLRAGTQLRISSQLIEVPAGDVLWSETAQVSLDDIFQVQDDLTRRIVDSLSLPLTVREHRMLAHDVPANAKAYEAYLRANQLSHDTKSWGQAKALYEQCLDGDPQYAPAWARLGGIQRLLGKYADEGSDARLAEAERALARALEINPDLALGHNLDAQIKIDRGRATEAMVRLISRAHLAADAEIYAALVSTCRFAGLLLPSLAADERARRLDPKIKTSVAQTYFQIGQHELVVDLGKEAPYVCAMSMVALGRAADAASYLARPLEKAPPRMRPIIIAAHAFALGKRDECADALKEFLRHGVQDPEARYYAARHLAWCGEPDEAMAALEGAILGGWFGFPAISRDPWLESLRTRNQFARVLGVAEDRHQAAVQAYRDAGAEGILGPAG